MWPRVRVPGARTRLCTRRRTRTKGFSWSVLVWRQSSGSGASSVSTLRAPTLPPILAAISSRRPAPQLDLRCGERLPLKRRLRGVRAPPSVAGRPFPYERLRGLWLRVTGRDLRPALGESRCARWCFALRPLRPRRPPRASAAS